MMNGIIVTQVESNMSSQQYMIHWTSLQQKRSRSMINTSLTSPKYLFPQAGYIYWDVDDMSQRLR